MKKIRKEMQEVEVVDYYAEVGDVITIPGKRGQFVVEEARMTGGGTAQGSDVYPDAWHVEARSLSTERTDAITGSSCHYDLKARPIKFTQHTNCYTTVIDGVLKVGQMKKFVTFEWAE